MTAKTFENETLSLFTYLANKFSLTEAIHIFDDNLGRHIFNKFAEYAEQNGYYGAMTRMVFELDKSALDKLIERACSVYNGRKLR